MPPCCQRALPAVPLQLSTSGAEPRGDGGGRGIPRWLNMARGCAARPESLSRCLAAQAASLIHHRCLICAAGKRLCGNYTHLASSPRHSSHEFNLKGSAIICLNIHQRLNAWEFQCRFGAPIWPSKVSGTSKDDYLMSPTSSCAVLWSA